MPTSSGVSRSLAVGVLALASLSAAHLHAQSASDLLPGARYQPILPPPRREPSALPEIRPQPDQGVASDAVVVDELKGLLFLDSSTKVKLIAPELPGIQTKTERPLLMARSPRFRARLQRYLNRSLSVEDLKALRKEITEFYRRHDMPVVGVLVPNQDTSSGTVQIVILEARVNRIRFHGNEYTCPRWLCAQLDTQAGAFIRGSRLNEDLRWLNRSEFRDVTLEMNPSDEEGRVDLDLAVEEDFPIRSSFMYADNGTRFLDIERLQFGVTHGNVFGMDQLLNYSYLATPDFQKVQVHSCSYLIPFNNRDLLSLYGYYGTTVSPLPPPFNQDGAVWQTSFRYLKLLCVDSRETSRRERRFTFGFDFKETNTNLDFGGLLVSQTSPDIAQLAFGYTESYVYPKGFLSLETELLWSPGGFSADNETEQFEQLRFGASAEYVYATGAVTATRYLGETWQWNVLARGQWADERLLPIETIGLGGEGSVRGFDTYSLNGDSGWCVDNELATRYKSLGLHRYLRTTRLYGSVRPVEDEFQAFAFFDVGGVWAKNAEPLLLEEQYKSISGTGVGLRYRFGPWIRLRAAYGWRVEDLTFPLGDAGGRPHVALTISR